MKVGLCSTVMRRNHSNHLFSEGFVVLLKGLDSLQSCLSPEIRKIDRKLFRYKSDTMQIQFFGLSSFKITTKDTTIITDPFDKKSGLTPPRGGADIVVLAEKNNPLYSQFSGITGDFFKAFDPGEYDTKGVAITGIPLKQEDGRYVTVFLLESEDIKILNLGHLKEFSIKEDDLEGLGDIDILLIPVGDNTVLDADKAAKAVNLIDPRIVIPCHYKIPGLSIQADPLDKFTKEMGGKFETMDKLSIKRKDLTGDDIKVIVLEPLR